RLASSGPASRVGGVGAPGQPAALFSNAAARNRRRREGGARGCTASERSGVVDSMTAGGSDPLPFVSVILPVRNEAECSGDFMNAVLAQDYPSDRFEVIVADGMSSDGTRDILLTLASQHRERLTVLDNRRRIVPAGLNLALQRARGDVIVRIDGHTL